MMGNIDETNRYYSAKHKLYGYKVEVVVLPDRRVISLSSHYPAKVQDIEIIMGRIEQHKKLLLNGDLERGLMDGGLRCADFEGFWDLLADKGYQDILEALRAILPKKFPPRRQLTIGEIRNNEKICSDRFIVES